MFIVKMSLGIERLKDKFFKFHEMLLFRDNNYYCFGKPPSKSLSMCRYIDDNLY